MEENHAKISKELDAIRFSKSIMERPNSTVQKQTILSESIGQSSKENVEFELPDDFNLEVIDFAELPQELFTQIEDFIKKEIPDAADDNDDIIEVPVPPKPAPEVVTLEEDNEVQLNSDSSTDDQIKPPESSTSNPTNLDNQLYGYNTDLDSIPEDPLDIVVNITDTPQVPNIQDNEKLTRLKILAQEESSLFNELKLLEETRSQIMSKLDYLRELRSQTLLE